MHLSLSKFQEIEKDKVAWCAAVHGDEVSDMISNWKIIIITGLVAHSVWDLPGSGVKPVSPELTGGFFTTEPPGKSYYSFFMHYES